MPLYRLTDRPMSECRAHIDCGHFVRQLHDVVSDRHELDVDGTHSGLGLAQHEHPTVKEELTQRMSCADERGLEQHFWRAEPLVTDHNDVSVSRAPHTSTSP